MTLNKKEQFVGVFITILAILLFSVYFIFSAFGLNNISVLALAFVIVFVTTIGICFFVWYKLKVQNKLVDIDYLNIGIQRYILGILMIFYGIPKLIGTFFDYQLFALDSKLMDVSEFELAWYYFGKNKWQELFAGIMEFIPGLLLLHRRTYYIAAIILLPVTAQVFILNFFFKIGGITFPAAIILLACNVYIIYSQKSQIIAFFKSLHFFPNIHFGAKFVGFIKLCKWFAVLIIVFLVYKNIKPIFKKSEYQLKYEKLIGGYTLESVTKNNTIYTPTKDSTLYKDLYIEKQSRWNILRRYNDQTDAFSININTSSDSIYLYINKGGIGDEKDILDTATVLKGKYKLNKDLLQISGIQLSDTLQLNYKKKNIKPKKWFW